MMTTAPPAHDPGRDTDELRVAKARRRVTELAKQLIADPLNPDLIAQLRHWLDTDADPAIAAMDALLRRPASELREQVRAAISRLDGTLRGDA
ncbi:hypothetical protein ACFRMQ_14530 [Kitasatospora sp. NPDC056783]|uniref:hypothetical protein n=1 Tax=Kitasatospora sp. NPDC056783 TaxID=3345943 RepID=UPI0036CA2B78